MRTREVEINLQVTEATLYQQLLIVSAMREDSRFSRAEIDQAAATYRRLEDEAKKQWAQWLRDKRVTA